MNNFIELGLVIGVIGFQTFSGYLGNKYLGAILPLAFIGLVIYFIVSGNLDFSLRNIVMSLLGPIVLFGTYESGKESKKKKIQKELDIMKAKDITRN